MNEKEIFAEIFGEAVQKQKEVSEEKPMETTTETPKEETPTETPANTKTEATEDKEDGEKEENNSNETPTETSDDKKSEDKEEEFDQKLIDDAKKELGLGGAAFCDELLANTPDAFSRLKESGKTLHGFYNFAYSYAMNEYVKKNGKVNGGGCWNLSELLEKYLDPSVKEGFTIKEPKAKPYVPSKPIESPAKTVAKVAKKAARAAKKEKTKKIEMKIVEVPKPKDEIITRDSISNEMFAGIDFSKIKI